MPEYNEILKQYEQPTYFVKISDPGVNEQRAVWFKQYLCLAEGSTVLELGAGKFTLTAAWRKLGMTAWGVDWSLMACVHAPDLAIRGMCQGLPFRDKSFDLVTAFDVFEHLPPEDLDRAVSELARVCRKHAALNIPIESPDAADHHHLSKFDRPFWEKLLAEYFDPNMPSGTVDGFNNNSSIFMERVREK